jgi:stage III sporulation protein AC
VNIDIILKIAGVGLLTAVINIVLKKSDKDEIATFTTLAGLIIVILMVIDMIGGLFDSVKSIFRLY